MPLFLLAGSPANREPCFVTGNGTPIFLMVANVPARQRLALRRRRPNWNICCESLCHLVSTIDAGKGLVSPWQEWREESGRILLGWYHSRQETR